VVALIEHGDERADPSWQIDRPKLDRSVLTGRSLKEIAEHVRKKNRLGRSENKHSNDYRVNA